MAARGTMSSAQLSLRQAEITAVIAQSDQIKQGPMIVLVTGT